MSNSVCVLDMYSGDTTRVLTGSADNTCKLWDTETGTVEQLVVIKVEMFGQFKIL